MVTAEGLLAIDVLEYRRRLGVIIQSDCRGFVVEDHLCGERRFAYSQPLGPQPYFDRGEVIRLRSVARMMRSPPSGKELKVRRPTVLLWRSRIDEGRQTNWTKLSDLILAKIEPCKQL